MEKILAAMLAFVMIFTLAACGQKPAAEEPAPAAAETEPAVTAEPADDGFARGNAVPTPDSSFVVRPNNIKYRTYTVTSYDGKEESSYIQFYGMKNEEVEDAINNQLRKAFEDLSDESYSSPFAGLDEEVKNRGLEDLGDTYINMNVYANYNNILSVVLTRSWYYYNDYDSVYSYVTEPFNFDLSTGKQIKLRDLVYDGADPDVFNDAVLAAVKRYQKLDQYSDDYYQSEYQAELVGDFDGLKEDQKFYIEDYTGNPVIVLDYENPEFDTHLSTTTVTADIRGISAIGQRFETDECLFEDETKRLRLLTNNLDEDKISGSYDYVDNYFEGEDIAFSLDYTSSEELPEELRELTVFTDEFIEKDMEEFRDIYKVYTSAYPYGLRGNVWMYAYPFRYGEFTNIGRQVGRSIWTADYNTVYSSNDFVDYCFRGDSVTPLTLTDIFKPSADIPALLKKAFTANIEDYREDLGEIDPETLDAFFDAMIENINGFYINSDSIAFSFGSSQEGIVYSFFPDAEYTWVYSGLCSNAEYDEIGCENLTIFD